MRRRQAGAAVAVTFIAVGCALAPTSPATAHPLGNFSVNHYHGLQLHPDRIEDLAVLDEAELPTLQQKPAVDRDGNGTIEPAEAAAHAATTCAAMAGALHAEVAGHTLTWTVLASNLTYHSGAANLVTGRTECHLTATVDLRRATTISFEDTFRTDRVGWHEATAVGHGIGLRDSPLPSTSISDELRTYPNDLLSSPLNHRSARIQALGAGTTSSGERRFAIAAAGPIARSMTALGDRLNTIAGADRLTPLAGVLAILLALLLGGAHAMLPGHGKTVMAAYIAGRRGTYRDAFTVGATVTATHTAGVLTAGLLLTTASTLAGETLLGWLGVVSGLLIAGIGASLLRSALPARRKHQLPQPQTLVLAGSAPGAHVTAESDVTASGHHHGDSHRHDHDHGHEHHRGHHHHHHARGRAGLLGMGIAGGIVPSPSALIVLLGAVALGRTWFGVLLVLAYGLGMAATLTLAGLLLVGLHQRLHRGISPRPGSWTGRLATATPILTATLVLVVGAVLTLRAVWPLLTPTT
ncbi:sulfite exporter TauE/SafE family protein [Micromonospora sp. NPDC005173]|uniref:urease accessory protein UreH domain-containing protein n=1 Tax=Micromonospora sp. NPDC005173 TaxID=3157165 RepID=UPI0033A24569